MAKIKAIRKVKPEVKTVFEYKTKSPRGVITAYVFRTSPVNPFEVLTFFDGEYEEAYAVASALNSLTEWLVKDAEQMYNDNVIDDEGEGNPFTELLNDKVAMERLSAALSDPWGGE
jgi:hypothetical protein